MNPRVRVNSACTFVPSIAAVLRLVLSELIIKLYEKRQVILTIMLHIFCAMQN
jgi:hypothetical protein